MPKTNNSSLDDINRESSEQLYFIVSMIPQVSTESEDFRRISELVIEMAKIAPFFDDPKSLKDIYRLKERMEKLVREINPEVEPNRGDLKIQSMTKMKNSLEHLTGENM